MKIRYLLCAALLFAAFVIGGCGSSPEAPEAQKNFTKLLQDGKKAYNDAGTDVKKNDTIAARTGALKDSYAKTPAFDGWMCKVTNVQAKGGDNDLFTKQKIVILTVLCDGFEMLNMDTTVFEGVPDNAIVYGTPLYDAVVKLDKGKNVAVSGKFMPSPDKGVRERSLTDAGFMTSPEFVVTFTAVQEAK